MNAFDMKIGTQLDLDIINSMGEKVGQTYISQLLNIEDAKNILIACPIHEGNFAFIPVLTHVRITYLDDKHGPLSFTGLITGKHKEGNIVTIGVKITGNFEKIQRREFFRLDCILDVLYRVIKTPDENSPEKQDDKDKPDSNDSKPLDIEFKKATTKNISGSGICIITTEKIEKNSLVEVVINLRKDLSIIAQCTVIRSNLLPNRRTRHEVGLKFVNIDERLRNTLIRFIFEEQRKIIRKTLPDKQEL